MNEKSEVKNGKYHCNICNKYYKSASSRWNHNKKFHTPENKSDINTNQVSAKNKSDINIHIYIESKSNNINEDGYYYCKNCNKKYKHIQSRWKHEKQCNKENNDINELRNLIISSITNMTSNNIILRV